MGRADDTAILEGRMRDLEADISAMGLAVALYRETDATGTPGYAALVRALIEAQTALQRLQRQAWGA